MPSAMSDASPSPAPAPHVVGDGYEFDEVRAFLGGDPKPPNFVIHKGTEVIGVCLGLGWNPRADSEPCEVWVGRKGDQPKWGIRLAETRRKPLLLLAENPFSSSQKPLLLLAENPSSFTQKTPSPPRRNPLLLLAEIPFSSSQTSLLRIPPPPLCNAMQRTVI